MKEIEWGFCKTCAKEVQMTDDGRYLDHHLVMRKMTYGDAIDYAKCQGVMPSPMPADGISTEHVFSTGE